ncbi:unnamed protein product [Rotaria sp. Silwood1]|nr:unnamed protein product [Rotaria sp. Silwood1]
MLPVGPYIPPTKRLLSEIILYNPRLHDLRLYELGLHELRCRDPRLFDPTTLEYQQLSWENLKRTINSLINKVNTSNLPLIIRELFKINMTRGYGLFIRNIIQAQIASPFYTPVYAALVSIINVRLPIIGEFIAKHLISSFRQRYQQNDKINCLATIKFIAHFVNQNILHDIVALEMLVFLLENPTDDNVELVIEFLKECGQKLLQVSPRGLDCVFSTLNNLLHQSSLDKHTQYMIEVLFDLRKGQFKSNSAIQPCLNLVDENDEYTHMITLDDSCQPEPILDVFLYDDHYEENETEYEEIQKIILDILDNKKKQQQTIIDQIETNVETFRCTIYSTIRSNIGVEECAHKLLNMNLDPEQEKELCQIILDKCAKKRRYKQFFGLLGQHFCSLKKEYVEYFEEIFQDQYKIIHRLEYIDLRKVAKFFAHLLATDAISWSVLRCIRLTKEDTTSSSRIYIINLFLELTELLGLNKLNNRLTDPTLTEYFQGLFPCDNPKNSQFSINFFTLIGLGELT